MTKTTVYTEDTIHIGRHTETRGSCKYDLQALSTPYIWDKSTENTNFVPNSIYHNFVTEYNIIICIILIEYSQT
jgi:hypothetical protein